jgi:hypothetical protein
MEAAWLIIKELTERLTEMLRVTSEDNTLKITFQEEFPWQEYFHIVDTRYQVHRIE